MATESEALPHPVSAPWSLLHTRSSQLLVLICSSATLLCIACASTRVDERHASFVTLLHYPLSPSLSEWWIFTQCIPLSSFEPQTSEPAPRACAQSLRHTHSLPPLTKEPLWLLLLPRSCSIKVHQGPPPHLPLPDRPTDRPTDRPAKTSQPSNGI